MQMLDPSGVGVRSLSECLTLQLAQSSTFALTLAIARDGLELLGKRDYIGLTALLGVSLGEAKQAAAGNVKKCAVGKHPKSEKHGNTAQFSEVERSGTQENCGGIGSGCRLRLRPLPVLRRRQSQRVARIDPNAVVVDKNIAENDRFDLFSR